ncbi:MAG: polyprenol monophosphomannose synthase [Acidobacteriota bacterium]
MDPSPRPDLSVILPTFREADSLPRLVPRVAEEAEAAGFCCELIVVDDASPDGTAQVARELAASWPVVVLERRGERGLATAVIAGIERARGEICLVMDADGSHPPEIVPRLAGAVAEGRAEVAVGSRLRPGGGFDGWPLWGRIKSRFAAFFARGLTSMSDPTTGLMAARRELLSRLELDPVGWKIVLEVVVKAAPAPFVEIPIVFGPRLAGRSKQNLTVFLQYLRHCSRLYFYRLRYRRPRSLARAAGGEEGR